MQEYTFSKFKNMRSFFKHHQDWILLNSPGFILFLGAYVFPNTRSFVVSMLGYSALFFLVGVLLLNPSISLLPKNIILKKINRHRRILGVASFVYAFFHAFLYIEKKGTSFFTKWVFHPVLLPGFIALIILLLLALTSNQFSIKKMGFVAWKKLHCYVYLAQFLVVLHLTLRGRIPFWVALCSFIPLYILQYIRRRKKRIQQEKKLHEKGTK